MCNLQSSSHALELARIQHRYPPGPDMTSERASTVEFLSQHRPFDQLPGSAVAGLAKALERRDFAAGEIVFRAGHPVTHLYVVASGAVEVRDASGSHLATLGKGRVFGQDDLLSSEQTGIEASARTAAVLSLMPAAEFHRLCDSYPGFRNSLYAESTSRDAHVRANLSTGSSLMQTAVRDLISRDAVTVSPQTSIRDAARVMRREGISSLLVTEAGALVGLVTDRDLRNRVIAEERSHEAPLSAIMTPSPVTIDVRRQGHEALVEMTRTRYHHLPVVDGDRIVGVITDNDLLRRHSASPLFLIGDIHRAHDVDALVGISERIRPLQVMLIDADAAYTTIGRVISSIGEAITSRLLVLAERELGESPVAYAWLTGGSLARFEQTSHSDQDNCLLIDDTFEPSVHGDYFKRLSEFVCDALNACGYVYCPGEIMAKTAKWCQPAKVWKRYFQRWIEQPEPKAQMHASIFFDLRLLHGDASLFSSLRDYVRVKASKNHIFHAFMASNALTHEPPLGFFRNFVLVKDGEHDRTLDLKHSGVIPIVDLARVYALAGAVAAVNTLERLDAAAAAGTVSPAGSADLRSAMEFIGSLRLRHEANRIRDNLEPDNFVPPEELSHL
ncbi:MAG: DUF294 nucleotidyltransferase-like domain-containing protein, partial [Gammaproteobacteria bacterium]